MTDEKTMQQEIPLKLIYMDEVEATDTRWLWYPYILARSRSFRAIPERARPHWCCIWRRN